MLTDKEALDYINAYFKTNRQVVETMIQNNKSMAAELKVLSEMLDVFIAKTEDLNCPKPL